MRVSRWAALLLVAALWSGGASAQVGGDTPYSVPSPGAMLSNAANAVLPTARDDIAANLGSLSWRTPADFGAKCDVVEIAPGGGASWAASGTSFTPGNSITPATADIGKKLVVRGAGTGGATYVGSITGVAGSAWTVSPALTQASGLAGVYGVKVATAQSGAGSYAPNDTITPTGGTITGGSQALLTVKYTKVVSATVAAGGSGGNAGTQTVHGTTGRGTYFSAQVTVAAGAITAVLSINTTDSVYGNVYFTNPTTLTAEPVSGANLTGATLNLKMGVAQAVPTNFGGYLVAPGNPVAQGSTSGSGTGATFTFQTTVNSNGHGEWYYGTDDGTAFTSAAAWSLANKGTVRLSPNARCGIGTTYTMSGYYQTIQGDGYGLSEANRSLANSPPNASLYWMGAAGSPIIDVATADNNLRRTGASVRNLSLIGANLASHGVRLRSHYGGVFENLYIEQATTAAFECNTNTNILAGNPSDSQFNVVRNLYLNQEGSNGNLLKITGDPSVATGDCSGNEFDNNIGWIGNDTAFLLSYSDSNYFNQTQAYTPSFSGALYTWDLTGIDGSGLYTYGNRIYGTYGPTIARGTTSSINGYTSKQNTLVFSGDPTATPTEEPGTQLDWSSSYLERRRFLTNKLITGGATGGTLYNARNALENTTAGAGFLTDATFLSAGANSYGFNVTYNTALSNFYYYATGPAWMLYNPGDGTYSLKGAASGTAGTAAAFGNVYTATALGGMQFGAPTGGDKGLGTLNLAAGGIYDNGTSPTGTGAYVHATSPSIASPTFTGTVAGSNTIPLTILSQVATNTLLGNTTSGTANVAAFNVGSCSTAGSALIWTTNTGPGCNTSITAAAAPASGLTGTTLASGVVTTSATTVGALASGSIASGFGTISTANTITTTVLASAGGLTVTGSPTPTNGVYLPAASTVGVVGASKLEFFAGAVNELDFAVTTAGIWTSTPGWTFSNAAVKMTGITTGTNADTVCLKADGTLLIQAAACTISSMRFKNPMGDYKASGALDTIASLEPIVFTMKAGEQPNADWNYDRPQIGLSAENVTEIEPRCAIYEQDGVTPKSYRQECLIAVLVAGMKEQQREIAALKLHAKHD